MTTIGRTSLAATLKVALDVVWWLMIVLAALYVLEAMVGLRDGPAAPRVNLVAPFELMESAYRIGAAELGVESVQFEAVSGTLTFHTTSATLLVMWFAISFAVIGTTLWIVLMLRRILGTLVAGAPFTRANASRLQVIGALVLALEVTRTVLISAQSLYLQSRFTADGVRFVTALRPNLGVLLLGFLLLVIAEVFRQGAAMREEQALTV